ncbi:uncharacterized protein LOC130674868 isoform X2 [Microplitis mediator]|uniref:uncharacterized protein LOC130674868 isoform X2 n=1 Tax=Microplitis mediator TaxID=375433 RepID=UPI0025521B5E|nr:uncharacterized protein LOC130674868 isoform X2 [Microplitis mediator]
MSIKKKNYSCDWKVFIYLFMASGGKKVVQLQNILLSDDDNKYTIRGTKDLIKQADYGRSKTLRVSINNKSIACTVIEISDDKGYLSSKIKSPTLGRGKRLKPVKRLNFSPGMTKPNTVPSRKVLSNQETNQANAQKKKIKTVQAKNSSQRERDIIERMRKKLKEKAQTTEVEPDPVEPNPVELNPVKPNPVEPNPVKPIHDEPGTSTSIPSTGLPADDALSSGTSGNSNQQEKNNIIIEKNSNGEDVAVNNAKLMKQLEKLRRENNLLLQKSRNLKRQAQMTRANHSEQRQLDQQQNDPRQNEKNAEKDAQDFPRVDENYQILVLDGIAIDYEAYLKAAQAKTMRRRANLIIDALWSVEQQVTRYVSDKLYEGQKKVTPQEYNNITTILEKLQRHKRLRLDGENNPIANIRRWVGDRLKRTKSANPDVMNRFLVSLEIEEAEIIDSNLEDEKENEEDDLIELLSDSNAESLKSYHSDQE